MRGINLDLPILYKYASFRYFGKHEHHITRFCRDNVLLLVFRGALRFSENGEAVTVCAGEYFIQQKNAYQGGEQASDAPEYLYVHFDAEWTEDMTALPYRGSFDHGLLFDLMAKLDQASHSDGPRIERQYLFLKLLLALRTKEKATGLAWAIADFMEKNVKTISSLSEICESFHYSKNYVIRTFRKEFGVSPIQYLNDLKIRRAMYLLETTSVSVGKIAEECGYLDYAYFYKRFVQRTGISPRKWREAVQHNPMSGM